MKLTASDGSMNDNFGSSIAFDGNTALIGAPFDDTESDSNIGSVYVFTRTDANDDSTWTQTMKLTASDGSSSDYFGSSIAFDGNTALITGGSAVYAFTRTDANDDSTWTQTMKLTASDGSTSDNFGSSIAFDGNTALITGGSAVYAFTRTDANDDSSWTQTMKLTASDGSTNDNFGSSIAFDGNTALIGAPFDDTESDSIPAQCMYSLAQMQTMILHGPKP